MFFLEGRFLDGLFLMFPGLQELHHLVLVFRQTAQDAINETGRTVGAEGFG
jgi:hypothetical protein